MRELITLQLGPFSNWVGSQFWNLQDEAIQAQRDEDGQPTLVDEEIDRAVTHGFGIAGCTPRLVLCDHADNFGTLGASGTHGWAGGPDEPQIDPLSWGGETMTVMQQVVLEHRDAGSASGRRSGNDTRNKRCEDERADGHDTDDDMRGDGGAAVPQPAAERRFDEDGGAYTREEFVAFYGDVDGPMIWEHAELADGDVAAQAKMEELTIGQGEVAGDAGDAGGEATRANSGFAKTASAWSDCLQPQLHSRTISKLKPHMHGYSSFSRFADGAPLVENEDDLAVGGLSLFEQTRRFLEECDTLAGFHLLVDANSGFGGMGKALLTRIRDDYTRAPCLTLGLGTLERAKAADDTAAADGSDVSPELGQDLHAYASPLNDATALTAFADLHASYLPLYGSAAIRALSSCVGLHASEMNASSYHSSAPIATLLHCASLPYRARQPGPSLQALVSALMPMGGMHLVGSSLAMPIPHGDSAGGHLRSSRQDWFAPLAPLQLPPRRARAFEQVACWVGHPGGGLQAAPLTAQQLPCRGDGGMLWCHPRPLKLSDTFPRLFAPPEGQEEAIDVPVATALQATCGIHPLINRVGRDWACHKRAAERAADAEEWGSRDQLFELTEGVMQLGEHYARAEGSDDADE